MKVPPHHTSPALILLLFTLSLALPSLPPCTTPATSLEVAGEPVIPENEKDDAVKESPEDEEELFFYYKVWVSESLWHIEWITLRDFDRFSGEVLVNGRGRFIDVIGVGDSSAVTIEWKPRHVRFRTPTGGIPGRIDFAADCESLIFKLYVNDNILPENIFIGAEAVNPLTIPFVLNHAEDFSSRIEDMPGPFLPQSVLWGKPGVMASITDGCFLWKDEKSEWNLHLKTGNPSRNFEGKITVGEGSVIHLSGDEGDLPWFEKGPRSLTYSVHPGNRELSLKFSSDSSVISFDLAVDGSARETGVFVGRDSTVPDSVPFNVINY